MRSSHVLRCGLVAILLLAFGLSMPTPNPTTMALPTPNPGITRGPTVNLLTNSSVVIMWTTQPATASIVEYGLTPASLSLNVTNLTSAVQHRLPITGLTSNTKYYYRAGNGTEWSATHAFTTAPNNDAPFTFLIYGDHRPSIGDTAPPQLGQLITLMVAHEPRFVISLGDHVLSPNPTSWASYAAQTDRIHGNASYWVTMGNHDGPGTSDLANWFEYPGETTRNYYSFDYGNCHFIILDSYDGGLYNALSASELAWLDADLAATTAKHRFVCVHAPFFGTGPHAGGSLDKDPAFRDALWHLFENRSVEAVFVAHEHYYYRLQAGTIPQITTGTGGAPIYMASKFNIYPVEVYRQAHHYVKADVTADSVTFTVYDINNQLIDTFTTKSILTTRPNVTDSELSPATPVAHALFNITATVTNSTPLASVTCRYREHSTSAYTSVPMLPKAGAADQFLATLGPLPANEQFYFYVEVNDTADANFRTLLGQFTIGTVAPTVTVQQPTNGSTLAGLVTVQMLAQDDYSIAWVEFYVDGVLQANESHSGSSVLVSWNWDTGNFSNGIHILKVVVHDGDGRSASLTVSVTILNQAPPIPPALIALAGVTIAGGVGVALFFVARKRRLGSNGKQPKRRRSVAHAG